MELDRSRKNADAANRAKSDFLANMSHEIRTPLNAILGMAELLETSDLRPNQRRQVSILRNAGDSLIRLIGDVLDLAKIEAAKLELERRPFDLHDLFESTVEVVAVGAHQKGLYLTLDVDPAVPRRLVGDAHRLRQVLLNLLGNAIKFTPRGGIAVDVVFEATVGRGARVRVAIADSGIGIPHDRAGNLFQPFTQVDASAARTHGGTGLGLSLCDRLLRLMDGRIWFESEPGRGSTFSFTVTLEKDATAGADGSDAPERGFEGRTALVVDDVAEERAALRRRLARLGFDVREADGGGAGILAVVQAARDSKPFDVVLLDSEMPAFDGTAVLEAIRDMAGAAARTVLLLDSDQVDAAGGSSPGSDAVRSLVRPIRESRLRTVLADVVLGRCETPAPSADVCTEASADLAGSILLADDSEDNRFVVQEFLKGTRLRIECVGNGEAAVAKASQRRFDLILMDMHMPVMDGFAAVRAIRSLEEARGSRPVPILAFTADAQPEDRERSYAAGCDGHVTKPVSKRSLVEALQLQLAGAVESGEDSMEHLAAGYLQRREADLTSLRTLLAEANHDEVRRLGHNMKGSGASYQFHDISRVGEQIEEAAVRGDHAGMEQAIDALDACLKNIRTGAGTSA